MREDDVRQDIKARLVATDAFSEVKLTGLPEDFGAPSGDYTAAFIRPLSGESKDQWDGGDATGIVDTVMIHATLMARSPDPETRDRLADLLLNALRDAVNGKSLANLTAPDLTRVVSYRYEKETAPERRVTAVVRYVAITDGWASYDTSA